MLLKLGAWERPGRAYMLLRARALIVMPLECRIMIITAVARAPRSPAG